MGYSKSPLTLARRIPMFGELEQNKECEWHCKVEEERALVYAIREALWIAAYVVPENYPKLVEAHMNFIIKATGQGKVIAIRREFPTPQPLSEVSTPTSTLTIASAIKNHPEKTHTFKNASLNSQALAQLLDLIHYNKLGVLLFWDEENSTLTAKPYSSELESLALTRDDLQIKEDT